MSDNMIQCEKLDWLKILMNQYSEKQIEDSYSYVKSNFMEIFEKDDFLRLDLETMRKLLMSDDLNVDAEEVVFETIIRWLEFHQLNLEENLNLLLDTVRLPLVSIEYLMTNVERVAYKNSKSRSQFIETIQYHLLPNKRNFIQDYKIKQRKTYRKLLSVGSWFMENSGIFEIYDVSTNTWSHLKTLDIKKRNYCAVIFDEKIMIIGGYNQFFLKTVEIIDLLTGKMSSGNPINVGRGNMAAVLVEKDFNSTIYIIGGFDNNALKSVEKWDSKSNTWSFVASMSKERNGCDAVLLDDKIYVVSGFSGSVIQKSMEVYDIKTDKWTIKASMNSTVSYCRVVTMKGYIYAIGGYTDGARNNPSTILERYDPRLDSWMTLASIPLSGLSGLWSSGNRIIAAGGFKNSKTVAEYDPEKNQWNNLAPLIYGRDGVILLEIPKKYFNTKLSWN